MKGLTLLLVCVIAALSAAACGASNDKPANDQTTVTVEKPGDAPTAPPAGSVAPASTH
jgi:hypothetical protein